MTYTEQRVKEEEHPWMSKEGKKQNAQHREGNEIGTRGGQYAPRTPPPKTKPNPRKDRANLKEKVDQQERGKASKLNL